MKENKKQKLFEWCMSKQVFSSNEVHRWGLENFYQCAGRRVREFVEDPNNPIKRIPDFEAKLRGLILPGNANIAWYEA